MPPRSLLQKRVDTHIFRLLNPVVDHKQRFYKSPFAKGWTDLVDGAQFQMASDCAMLALQQTFQPASDMGSAAANESRRQGAIQFLKILRQLGINPPTPPPQNSGQLQHAS